MKHGMTNNVSTVETSNPKRITFASGDQRADFPPMPTAIGIRPDIVVTEVRMIGRSRKRPAFTMLRQMFVTDPPAVSVC